MSQFSKWEMKRALTTEELSGLLEEGLDYQNYDSIDVVYIPPEKDSLTDEENIDENIIGEEIIEGDIAGTCEIQVDKDSDDSDDDIPLRGIAERVEANVVGTSGIQLNEDSYDSEDDIPLSGIARSLLKCSDHSSKTDETSKGPEYNPLYGRPSKSALPDEIKFDNVGHVIIRDTNSTKEKCRFCKSDTIYLCKKCEVHVNPDCSENYHIEK